jgi:hypothetical protein
MRNDALYSKLIPPTIQEVKIYFSQKGISEKEAEHFFFYYEKKLWTSKKGNFFKNWKSIAYRWIASVWKYQPWLFDRDIH